MSTKKMGIADRAIFILGITLAGVITFVLVAGVIIAVLKFYMDSKKHSARVHSVPMLDDEPDAALTEAPLTDAPPEQKLTEAAGDKQLDAQ